MLDMHTKVTIKDFIDTSMDTSECVLMRVSYRVKRGRKDYKIWLLPEDFTGTGLLPLSYKISDNYKYATVYAMDNKIVCTGGVNFCTRFVKLANKRFCQHNPKGVHSEHNR